jgi:hypothetical protein
MSESFYVIRLRGHLSPDWADWFEGMTLLHTPESETLLYGEIVDQPALHGLLIKVRDLGLTLLALNCVHKQDFLLTLRENTEPDRTH